MSLDRAPSRKMLSVAVAPIRPSGKTAKLPTGPPAA
jgi:hypothetical protein